MPGKWDRASAYQSEASLDKRAGRTDEPNHQRSHRQALPLRRSRPIRGPPRRLHRRLQLWATIEDPKGPHPIRTYLQSLDIRAPKIQAKPDPSNAGTKHLVNLPRMPWIKNFFCPFQYRM